MAQPVGFIKTRHHPKFLEALKRVVDTAHRHSLGAGIQPGNLGQAQEWLETGFNVISYSGDLYVYLEAITQAVAGLRKLSGG